MERKLMTSTRGKIFAREIRAADGFSRICNSNFAREFTIEHYRVKPDTIFRKIDRKPFHNNTTEQISIFCLWLEF